MISLLVVIFLIYDDQLSSIWHISRISTISSPVISTYFFQQWLIYHTHHIYLILLILIVPPLFHQLIGTIEFDPTQSCFFVKLDEKHDQVYRLAVISI